MFCLRYVPRIYACMFVKEKQQFFFVWMTSDCCGSWLPLAHHFGNNKQCKRDDGKATATEKIAIKRQNNRYSKIKAGTEPNWSRTQEKKKKWNCCMKNTLNSHFLSFFFRHTNWFFVERLVFFFSHFNYFLCLLLVPSIVALHLPTTFKTKHEIYTKWNWKWKCSVMADCGGGLRISNFALWSIFKKHFHSTMDIHIIKFISTKVYIVIWAPERKSTGEFILQLR